MPDRGQFSSSLIFPLVGTEGGWWNSAYPSFIMACSPPAITGKILSTDMLSDPYFWKWRVCAVNSSYILIILIQTAISLKYKEPAVRVVWTMEAEHVNDVTNAANRAPDVLLPRILFWEQIQQDYQCQLQSKELVHLLSFQVAGTSARRVCQQMIW